jgi:PST family polysaccharide transporter
VEAREPIESAFEIGAEAAVDLEDHRVIEGPAPDLAGKAAGGFFWMLVGFVVLQLGSFGTFAMAGNYLSRDEVGLAGSLLTVVFWADVLLDIGMGASLIYEQEDGHSRRVHVAFTVNTIAAVVVSLAVLFGAPGIAGFFHASSDVNLFRLLALLVLAKGLNQIPDALLRREMDFRRRMLTDVVRSVGRFSIASVMLLHGADASAMAISVVVAESAAVALTWFLVRYRPHFRLDRGVATEMLHYGAAVFGARLVGMLWLNGDYLVVGNKLGGKSKAYGDYYTAFRLPELVLGSVYAIFSSVSFPMYSAAREVNPEKLRQSSLKSLRLLCLFGFPAGVGMSLIARDFILTVFNQDSVGAIRPMEILCLAGALVAVGYASGDLFNAIGKPRIGLYLNLIGTPVLIGGFLLVVQRGIVAVSLVHLCVMVPYSLVRIEVANRLVGTTWGASLLALRPAILTTIGVVACGLPVRLLVGPGFLTGVEITFAGLAGALALLALGDRGTLGEVIGLARKSIGR